MVKFASILSLLAIFPLTLGLPQSLPRGHVQSTFELNYENNLEPYLEESLRLIKTDEDNPPEWMTNGGIMNLIRNNIKFMDVTDYLELGTHYKFSSARGKFYLFFKKK